MILLTKNNAKERCRTCLCKLLKCENDCDAESLKSKFADINSNKELQEMLQKYLPIQLEVDFYKDQLYPQYMCLDCLKHLQVFENFRNKAIDSANKLHRVFTATCNVTKIKLNDDGLECKVDAGSHSNDCMKEDIFNLFLKDSLMETEAIILDDADNHNDVNNIDPDPFQITQNGDNSKKQRNRGAKSKRDYIVSSKNTTRNAKKCSRISKHESIKSKFESSLEERNRTRQVDNMNDGVESFDWRDSNFRDRDYDSSDNEVLSKKIIHSNREVEKIEENRIITNLEDKNSYSKNEYTPVSLNSKVRIKGDFKNMLIKTELDSGSDRWSDNEFTINADILPKAIKVEKKKRHYILNSGRKKGLANRYKCDQCQHKFGHKLTLEAHVRKVHEGQKKAFKCQLCDKAYSFIGGLSTHIRDVHERKQDSYDCSVPGCDKKYSNYITLQRHVRVKHLNMEAAHQYVCEQCGATFKQSSNLRYHMKTRHPTEEDLKRKELLPKDRLECEECKKSFHSQYTLKYHKLRVHADEKKFECKICGRRVAKQFMLDSHMLVHSDQKMACKFCGREFVRKYQVEAHIRAVHQKLKPFPCPHCSESFASRKTLRHHIYIHTGEKPYVCDICGQAYRQPTCLKNHRKIHNKVGVNNSTAVLTANRSFISNFAQNNDALTNGEGKTKLN